MKSKFGAAEPQLAHDIARKIVVEGNGLDPDIGPVLNIVAGAESVGSVTQGRIGFGSVFRSPVSVPGGFCNIVALSSANGSRLASEFEFVQNIASVNTFKEDVE